MKFQRISDWSRRHPAAVGCLGLIFLVVVLLVGFDSYTRIRFYSEIRALERMGIPCDIEGFAERQRSSGASEELTREFQKLCDAISTDGFPPPDNTSSMMLLTLEDLPAFLAERAEKLRAADRFLDEHPDWIVWRDFSGYSVSSSEASVAELLRIRAYVSLNHDRFFYALLQDDPEEAIRNFDRSAILRDYALRDPLLYGYLLARQLERIRLDSLFDSAFGGKLELFDSSTLKRWADSMPEIEAAFRSGARRAMESDLGLCADALAHPQNLYSYLEDPDADESAFLTLLRPLVRLDGAATLRVCRETVLPLAAEDYTPETARKLAPFQTGSAGRGLWAWLFAPVSETILPSIPFLFQNTSVIYARCRVVRTGLAVELFWRKYGRLPEKLDELVPEFLSSVPVSPFTEKPLRIEVGTLDYYRPETKSIGNFEGYRVYIDGDPTEPPVGLTRTDRNGRIPVWNRAMKLSGGGEGKE
ncbi:hypothetical protein [uncultured Victivallis sp.]|uniref:hypothetical protein n=1 Tax=uncultured Victivallis sp. TaxID=354118 RepID=UPI0025F97E01|nr:hypothetical protein [uncultured Victivallis sp.]